MSMILCRGILEINYNYPWHYLDISLKLFRQILNISLRYINPFPNKLWFLAPSANYCHGVVSVHPCVRVCVREHFLQKISPQKLLTGFLRNFTGMFHSWSSFKFLQIIVFYEEFWLPWQSK